MCPVPGSVQGQAGCGFEKPVVVGGVPACGRSVGTRWSLRSLPTQTILWVYDSVNDYVLLVSLVQDRGWLAGVDVMKAAGAHDVWGDAENNSFFQHWEEKAE